MEFRASQRSEGRASGRICTSCYRTSWNRIATGLGGEHYALAVQWPLDGCWARRILNQTHCPFTPATPASSSHFLSATALVRSKLRWFSSGTGQGTAPESGRRDDGEGVSAVDGEA